MADIDDVMANLADDPAFRAHVEADPRTALDGWELSTDDLARIQGNLDPPAQGPTVRSLFEPQGGGGLSSLIGLLVPALAVAGLVVGAAAGAAGVAGSSGTGETAAVETAAVAVDAFDCPDGATALTLHGGDRVLVVGRDSTGAWLQVRDPSAPAARVWLDAAAVNGDGDLGSVPVASCAGPPPGVTTDAGEIAAPATSLEVVPSTDTTLAGVTTVPTTVPTVATTVRTGPPATTVATTPTSRPPVTTVTTTATTAAPDTTPPTLGAASASPADIWEKSASAGGLCASQITSRISVTVSDASAIGSVTLAWQVGAQSGARPMTGGATRSADLGSFPFPAGVPDSGADIAVTVTATDVHGNQATTNRVVRLHSASECIG